MTWTALEALLDATGLEYARQGSYAGAGSLPESFFTFWNIETPETRFYDNVPHAAVWRWQIYYYTKNPETLYSAMDDLIADARERGFIIDNRARDLDADEPGYSGRTVRLAYIENALEED